MAVYRGLAAALGLRPAYRRDELWRQLKATLAALYERESLAPLLVLDEAHHLGDDFLHDLAGFLNHKFDRRDLMTIWLVSLPSLRARLDLQVHAALRSRIVSPNALGPRPPGELAAMIRHGAVVPEYPPVGPERFRPNPRGFWSGTEICPSHEPPRFQGGPVDSRRPG